MASRSSSISRARRSRTPPTQPRRCCVWAARITHATMRCGSKQQARRDPGRWRTASRRLRSEERREGKSVDLGGRRIIKKKKKKKREVKKSKTKRNRDSKKNINKKR